MPPAGRSGNAASPQGGYRPPADAWFNLCDVPAMDRPGNRRSTAAVRHDADDQAPARRRGCGVPAIHTDPVTMTPQVKERIESRCLRVWASGSGFAAAGRTAAATACPRPETTERRLSPYLRDDGCRGRHAPRPAGARVSEAGPPPPLGPGPRAARPRRRGRRSPRRRRSPSGRRRSSGPDRGSRSRCWHTRSCAPHSRRG